VRACPLSELTEHGLRLVVRTPMMDALAAAIVASSPAAHITPLEDGSFRIDNVEAAQVGRAALEARVELHELRPATSDLEAVFLSLTGGAAS
jgi:ABC-2 type transport system ATP-binding protein